MSVRNGCDLLGLETQKSAITQNWIDFSCWYKFSKAKSHFNNCLVGMVKNEWGCIDHGTVISGVSHKWFDELSVLTEWFLHADSDGINLCLMASPIYFVSLTSKWWGTTAVVLTQSF